MPSEDVNRVLASTEDLDEAARVLIQEANNAGGRDNITVVLFRLEEVGTDAASDQPTMIGEAAPDGIDSKKSSSGSIRCSSSNVAVPTIRSPSTATSTSVRWARARTSRSRLRYPSQLSSPGLANS